jgi:Domain of unknown function (DUF6946)
MVKFSPALLVTVHSYGEGALVKSLRHPMDKRTETGLRLHAGIRENPQMRISKSGNEIRSVEDWFKYAPPKMGERHWGDGRSAKELARSWFRRGIAEPPDELAALLVAKFGAGITFDEAKPECVVKLDEFAGEHRNCDFVVFCNAGAKRMVISVEAKADEPFGDVIGDYYDQKSGSGSNVPSRIRQLSKALFGREPDEAIRKLRYQLLHAAAATLIEAAADEAETGLFLIHQFRSASLNKDKVAQNAADWENFVRTFPELSTARIEKNQILGPVSVPGGERVPRSVPLYLGQLVTELK